MVRHLTLLCLLAIAFPGVTGAETMEHAGTTYWIYRVAPGKEKIELHLSEKAGVPHTFPKLEERLRGEGRRLKFAMNAGIFEGNFCASGLHIAEGETITPLNLDDFVKRSEGELTPNFFLKPNGVMMDQAEILKGTAYPTVMVLPHQGITTSQGVVAGLRNFAQKVGKPIVLYIKYGDYISVEGAKELVDEGLVSWIKYAIVREDPANDPYLAQLVDVVDPALIVSGIGEQPVIEHLVDFGVNGFTAGCVCIRPELSDQLLKAVQAKDLTRAREIQAIFEPLEDLRNGINPIRVLHEAVRLAGIAETGPALPLLSGISEVQTEEVKAAALTLLHANG